MFPTSQAGSLTTRSPSPLGREADGSWPSLASLTGSRHTRRKDRIVPSEVIDQLVLTDEEHTFHSDGIVNGGGEHVQGAVQGPNPAAVDRHLKHREDK